jgi:hypothetical protein
MILKLKSFQIAPISFAPARLLPNWLKINCNPSCCRRQIHSSLAMSSQIGGLKTQVEGIPTIDELRRKLSAAKNASEFKREMSNPDRIIGRAYAELEEERKYAVFSCSWPS